MNKLQQGNVNLVCYCHPKRCHAEVIKEVVLDMIAQKKLQ
jgi:hypothetical protein